MSEICLVQKKWKKLLTWQQTTSTCKYSELIFWWPVSQRGGATWLTATRDCTQCFTGLVRIFWLYFCTVVRRGGHLYSRRQHARTEDVVAKDKNDKEKMRESFLKPQPTKKIKWIFKFKKINDTETSTWQNDVMWLTASGWLVNAGSWWFY